MSELRDRWLLPAGIEETLPPLARVIETSRRALVDLFQSWGYELVMPPLIEYLESLLTGTGPDLDLQTCKIIDQISGRMMGVRADMTPQVARIEAHYLKREVPVRLCYLGTVLHTRPHGFSGSRSPLQVGAELYGHAGPESDCEILGLMLETLGTMGIGEVHLDIGHMGIFRELAAQARLTEEQEADLFERLQRKATSEIERLLADAGVLPSVAEMILCLAELNGAEPVLSVARERLGRAGREVNRALDRLESIAAAMSKRCVSTRLHFDLAELRGYRYERGVVFAAFIPGHGQEIARGGRYDGIGEAFGRARPAIGFSTDLRTLVACGAHDERGEEASGIFAPASDCPRLQAVIRELRARGERVVNELAGQSGGASDMGCDRVLCRELESWVVKRLGDPGV